MTTSQLGDVADAGTLAGHSASVVRHYARTASGKVRRHDWGAPVVAYRRAECSCGWVGQSLPGTLPAEASHIAQREAAAHEVRS